MLPFLRTYQPANPRSKTPSLISLLLIRRQAEAGLLREGGITVAQVSRYVRELRREIEQERALRRPGGIAKARRTALGVAPSRKKLRVG
jgi:hypothetical protein